MNSITEIGSKSSFVSIRKALAQNVLPDTHEDQKVQIPAIGIDGLRTIGRIVNSIKAKFNRPPGPLGTDWPPTAVGSC